MPQPEMPDYLAVRVARRERLATDILGLTLAPIEAFPQCDATRPGRTVDRIPDFSDLVDGGGGGGGGGPVDDGATTPQSVPATCPPGFVPAAAGCYRPVPTTAPDPVTVTVPP